MKYFKIQTRFLLLFALISVTVYGQDTLTWPDVALGFEVPEDFGAYMNDEGEYVSEKYKTILMVTPNLVGDMKGFRMKKQLKELAALLKYDISDDVYELDVGQGLKGCFLETSKDVLLIAMEDLASEEIHFIYIGYKYPYRYQALQIANSFFKL